MSLSATNKISQFFDLKQSTSFFRDTIEHQGRWLQQMTVFGQLRKESLQMKGIKWKGREREERKGAKGRTRRRRAREIDSVVGLVISNKDEIGEALVKQPKGLQVENDQWLAELNIVIAASCDCALGSYCMTSLANYQQIDWICQQIHGSVTSGHWNQIKSANWHHMSHSLWQQIDINWVTAPDAASPVRERLNKYEKKVREGFKMLPFPPLLLIVILAKGEFDKDDDYDDHDIVMMVTMILMMTKSKWIIITIARDETRVQSNKIFAWYVEYIITYNI